MPQTVKGVLSRSKGADVEVVDVVVPDPGPGEVEAAFDNMHAGDVLRSVVEL